MKRAASPPDPTLQREEPDNKCFVAADTGVARAGQAWASTADKALFADAEWSPRPVGEWAGDCPKLPYVAWKSARAAICKNDAIANYWAYKNAGLIKTGVPPRGAVVF